MVRNFFSSDVSPSHTSAILKVLAFRSRNLAAFFFVIRLENRTEALEDTSDALQFKVMDTGGRERERWEERESQHLAAADLRAPAASLITDA